jgi:hypothetical protein
MSIMLTCIQTSDQIVKAFQWEKYSQIPEMCILDDRLDNSFQRDLTKMEHLRMKVLYDGLSVESVEIELVELRYMFNRGACGSFGRYRNTDGGIVQQMSSELATTITATLG